MAVNLTLKEPRRRGYSPPKPYGLYAEGLPPHEIIRLLLGSVNVRVASTGRTLTLSENAFRKKHRRMCKPISIARFVFEGDLKLSEYESFIKALSARNYEFFERIRKELTLALVAQRDQRFTEAFLYIYRILEMMAVAFPLLYATTQSDFLRAHEFLKSLVDNKRDGHLKVLNLAVPIISAQAPNLSGVTFDFSISGSDERWVAALRRELERCDIHRIGGFEFEPDTDILFRVPFNDMPSVLIQFRNRMFHYRVGEPNIDLAALGGSEQVCKMLVPEATHWFALIYAELLRVMARRQF